MCVYVCVHALVCLYVCVGGETEREGERNATMVTCSQLSEHCYKEFTPKILICKYPEDVINILV